MGSGIIIKALKTQIIFFHEYPIVSAEMICKPAGKEILALLGTLWKVPRSKVLFKKIPGEDPGLSAAREHPLRGHGLRPSTRP